LTIVGCSVEQISHSLQPLKNSIFNWTLNAVSAEKASITVGTPGDDGCGVADSSTFGALCFRLEP